MPINPVEILDLVGKNDNIYETIIVLGRRARQLNDEIRSELYDKLALFNEFTESEEEAEFNHEQARISVEYEMKDKPTIMSIKQKQASHIDYQYQNEVEPTVE